MSRPAPSPAAESGADATDRLAIPLPARFRAAPLIRLPWGAGAVPGFLARAEGAPERLRAKIRERYGVEHCILTDSARSAYALAVEAMGLEGEILLPAMMYTPLAMLLAHRGLEPAFADVGRDFVVEPERFERMASPRTRAVFVGHLFGRISEADRIHAWARGRSLRVLGNLAHAPDTARVSGEPLAAFADAAFLSFHWDKPTPGIHGGALITGSTEIYEAAARIALAPPRKGTGSRNLLRALALYRYKPLLAPARWAALSAAGRSAPRDAVGAGFASSRGLDSEGYRPRAIHPWQAAVAEAMLDRSQDLDARRRALAARAVELMNDVPGLTLPGPGARGHAFIFFPVILDEGLCRYRVGAALARRGIEAKWRYYPPPLQRPMAHCRTDGLALTRELWKRFLLLPVTHGTERDVERVAEAVRQVMREEVSS